MEGIKCDFRSVGHHSYHRWVGFFTMHNIQSVGRVVCIPPPPPGFFWGKYDHLLRKIYERKNACTPMMAPVLVSLPSKSSFEPLGTLSPFWIYFNLMALARKNILYKKKFKNEHFNTVWTFSQKNGEKCKKCK